MSENAPYDLICDTGNKLLKIQVKYRKDGVIPHSTSWADKNGTHSVKLDENQFDYFALVNEDYSKICYPLSIMKGMTIRFMYPTKNCNAFNYYEDYLDFKSEIQEKHNLKNILNINKEEFLSTFENSLSIDEITSKLNIGRNSFYKYINYFNLKDNEIYIEYKKRILDYQKNNKYNLSSKISKELLLSIINESNSINEVITKLNISQTSYNRLYNLYLIENETVYKDFLLRVNKIRTNNLPRFTKIQWPPKEELEKLLWEKPTTYIAKELGVSDKAVEKHIKKLGLTKPPRGYWVKQKK